MRDIVCLLRKSHTSGKLVQLRFDRLCRYLQGSRAAKLLTTWTDSSLGLLLGGYIGTFAVPSPRLSQCSRCRDCG